MTPSPRVDLTGLPFASQRDEIYDLTFRLFFSLPEVEAVRAKLLALPAAKLEAEKRISNAVVFYLAS